MHCALLFDKSAIQMLSHDEASWLHHFANTVITPVVMTEALGNLRKEWRDGRSPEQFLASLAAKIKGFHGYHNVPSEEMLHAELAGYEIEMDGRPAVGGGQTVTDSRGHRGIFFGEPPEDAALRRWTDQDFTAAEEELAALWREGLRQRKIASKGRTANNYDIGRLTSVAEVAAVANDVITRATIYLTKHAPETILGAWTSPHPASRTKMQPASTLKRSAGPRVRSARTVVRSMPRALRVPSTVRA